MNYSTKSKRGFSATLILLIFFLVGNIGAWAQDEVVKTLDFTAKSAKNSDYKKTWDYDDLSLYGGANNSGQWAYVRFGGKAASSETTTSSSSKIASKSAISSDVDYINIEHLGINGKGASSFKITSIVLEASEDSKFENIISTTTVTPTDEELKTSTTTKTFSITPESAIPANSYYRITINWSMTNTNNSGLDIKKVVLMKKPGSTGPSIKLDPTENTYSFDEPSGSFNYTITNPVADTNVTATPNNGWITSATANETEGTVSFTMQKNETGADRIGTITVKYGDATDAPTAIFTVKQSKKPKTAPGISYTTTDYTINLGETFATPKLNNPNHLTATYSIVSTPTEAISINETTGDVTITAAGTATITATTPEDETYEAGTASYTLKVIDPNKIFTLVTADNGLKDGDEIMFVGYNETNKEYHAMAGLNATKKTYYDETTAIEVAKDLSTAVQTDDATILKVEKYGENLYLYDATNGYIYMSGDKQIGHKKNIAEADYIKETEYNTDQTIVLTLSTTQASNKFLYNPGSKRFNCYAATGTSVKCFYIYRKPSTTPVETMTIDMTNTYDNDGFYYRTFSSTKAFKVPADLTVSEIAVIDGELLVDDYKEGDVVAANTGVMLWSLEQKEFTVDITTEEGTTILGADNMLRPSGDAGITAADMAAKDAKCIFYRLTTNKDNVLCYCWGAADGAAFALDANKAYLAVPTETAQGIKAYSFGGNGTTAIDKITDTISAKAERKVYNLQGQRVSGTPAPGLYIVNGKKVVIK